jgi:hypothetical protein
VELLPFFLLRSLYTPPDGPAPFRAAVHDALLEYLLTTPGGYGAIHTTLTDALLQDLDAAQLRRCPAPGVNAIAWLLWHMARCEDVGVNRLVSDGRQVLDDGS